MSLKSIGRLYPTLPLEKIDLTQSELSDMTKFFEDDPERFSLYAIQDSKIVL